MWSFGAILAELYTGILKTQYLGFPLFPGENEMEQLGLMMEIKGVPSSNVLEVSSRKKIFFDNHGNPILAPNSRGKFRVPSTKNLAQILRCQDRNFIDFVEVMF